MQPYYQDDYITIVHGNCEEVLPGLPGIDSLITDPPYGMNMDTDSSRFSGGHRSSQLKRGAGKDWGGGIVNDDKPFGPAHLLNYRRVVLWGFHHFASALPVGSVLVWLKRFDVAFGSFLSDAELAWMNTGVGVYCFRDLSMNAIAQDRQHPSQKPVPLMRWTIEKANPMGLVCDPYAGSGSILVAAKELGLKAIGIEIVEEYCQVAADRVSKTGMMFPVVRVALPEPEQISMDLAA